MVENFCGFAISQVFHNLNFSQIDFSQIGYSVNQILRILFLRMDPDRIIIIVSMDPSI